MANHAVEVDEAAARHNTNTQAAVSLLNDWSSFQTRLGAADFLNHNHDFPNSAITFIWQCIYREQRPEVIATLLGALGNLQERAADSVPLIAYHLADPRPEVMEAAVKALCQLSPYVEHALVPLMVAELRGNAKEIRNQHMADALAKNDARVVMYKEELDWIRSTPRQERAKWIDSLPRIGLSKIPHSDRARFLLLYADPAGAHVWGCLKIVWLWQKAAPDAIHQDIERSLSACEGSFFQEIASYGEPTRTRFLAKALTLSKPFTASLAHPLGMASVDTPQGVSLRIKAASVQIAPETPPEESLRGVLDGLWYENDEDLRTSAIDYLHDLIPNLGEQSARWVIDDVFNFLHQPVVANRSVINMISQTVTAANSREVPYILEKTSLLLTSEASRDSKLSALSNLAHLQYAGPTDSAVHDAQAILLNAKNLPDKRISGIATIVLNYLSSWEHRVETGQSKSR